MSLTDYALYVFSFFSRGRKKEKRFKVRINGDGLLIVKKKREMNVFSVQERREEIGHGFKVS